MNIMAFNGSPRKNGNTAHLLQALLRGARDAGDRVDEFNAKDLVIKDCRGCLLCNMIKRCSLSNDDWEAVADKILDADRLVFATPVYFHHVTASLKRIIDRFRSFLHVQITETGLLHQPWQSWHKEFILLVTMGSSDARDAQPIIDLFKFMIEVLGPGNRLSVITATRLAVPRQIAMSLNELKVLYRTLQLSVQLAEQDLVRNQKLIRDCYALGNTKLL